MLKTLHFLLGVPQLRILKYSVKVWSTNLRERWAT